MERCETCRHWRNDGRGSRAEFGLGLCDNIPMFWDATDWSDDGERHLKPEYAAKKAFAQDGSDYSASVYTMPDFGCVSHEPEPPK